MHELLLDIKSAIHELIRDKYKPEPVRSIFEQSKYNTYCVMAIDMRSNGYRIREIAKMLKVTKKEVKAMLLEGSVARVNRNGGSK